MRIGLIDVDSHNFPNLALMKISAWHKINGDYVEMVYPLNRYDRIYASKIFDFTPDIDFFPQTEDLLKGGTGYGISRADCLPNEIEHIMPDYSLYGIKNTAYGYLSRGCPRGCPFCIVAEKEGRVSRKVANLREWWNGQKEIKLLDPNITSCPDCIDLFGQLKESNAWIDFTQGIDIRLLTDEKVAALNALKIKMIHFAWDNNEDLKPLFRKYAPQLKIQNFRQRKVYVLVNYNTSIEWDLYRIYTLRGLDYDPFVMVYDKKHSPPIIRHLQRWCNNKFIYNRVARFEDYITGKQS